MANEIVTRQELENAHVDAGTLESVINGGNDENVVSRLGAEYPTISKALYTIIQNGGFEPFQTEVALLATVPTVPKKAAKALDTRKIWFWNGSAWIDTGLSDVDITKKSMLQLNENIFSASKYLSNHADYISGGTFTNIETAYGRVFQFTKTTNGSNGFGFNFATAQNKSTKIVTALVEVDNASKIDSIRLTQLKLSTNQNANISLSRIPDTNIFEVKSASYLADTDTIRLYIQPTDGSTVIVKNVYFAWGGETKSGISTLNITDIASQVFSTEPLNTKDVLSIEEKSGVQYPSYKESSATFSNEKINGIACVGISAASATGYAGYSVARSKFTSNKISASVFVDYSEKQIAPATSAIYLNQLDSTGTSVLRSNLNYDQISQYIRRYYFDDVDLQATTQTVRLVFAVPANAKLVSVMPKIVDGIKSIHSVYDLFASFDKSKASNANLVSFKKLIGLEQADYVDSSINFSSKVEGSATVQVYDNVSTATGTRGFGWHFYPTGQKKISASIKVKASSNIKSAYLSFRKADNTLTGSNVNLVKYKTEGLWDFYRIEDIDIYADTFLIRLFISVNASTTIEIKEPFVAWGGSSDFKMSDFDASVIPNPNNIDHNEIAKATAFIKDPFATGALRLVSGQIVDKFWQPTYFSCFGSSTINSMENQLQALAAEIGCPNFYAGGQGGERIRHTSARMGARKARIKFPSGQIPASGFVDVEHDLENNSSLVALLAYKGTILGVHGTLAYNASSLTGLRFTRTTSGSVVNAPFFYDFEPDFDKRFLDGYCIINIAKNDCSDAVTGAEDLLLRTVEMYQNLRSGFKHCLILNNFNNAWSTTNGASRDLINTLNARLADYFGDYLIDVNSYLLSEQVWIDTGITPTADDLLKQSEGKLAYGLSLLVGGNLDGSHMGLTTSQAVIDHLIKPRMIELGWIE